MHPSPTHAPLTHTAPLTHEHTPHQVKQIEKRDSVLTSAQQIDRLLKPGSKYLNLNPYEVRPIKMHASNQNTSYEVCMI